jgi:hypothetical protein
LGPYARNWEEIRERARIAFGLTHEEAPRRAELRRKYFEEHPVYEDDDDYNEEEDELEETESTVLNPDLPSENASNSKLKIKKLKTGGAPPLECHRLSQGSHRRSPTTIHPITRHPAADLRTSSRSNLMKTQNKIAKHLIHSCSFVVLKRRNFYSFIINPRRMYGGM